MPVPDFQSLMLPILQALADGKEAPLSEIRSRVATSEGLTPEDRQQKLPTSGAWHFATNVAFAITHLSHAGLIEWVGRAVYRLTQEGRNLVSSPPERVDMNFLRRRYPAYVAWLQRTAPEGGVICPDGGESTDTPEEALGRAAEAIRRTLEDEILARVREAPPAFLEQVVVDLLIAMGYGGGDAGMGRVTGRSGDGGIDGTIKEDTLGLDEVFIQAKKHTRTVGEDDLRSFAGAIDAAGTTKGVFVTTATFTSFAKDYVKRSPKRIVLIDGEELVRLMARHNIGVRVQACYELKRVDEDYFDQEGL